MNYLLHHILESAATRNPDHIAFRFGEEAISYSALDERANQLAHLLLKQGLNKGDRVGIYLHRCLESVVAVYGIFKAGGAYVPLDPSLPLSRIQALLQNCEIQHLISSSNQRRNLFKLVSSLPLLKALIGYADERLPKSFDWHSLDAYPITDPQLQILDTDLAYIIYTSGSTGTPKGIMHTHASGRAYAQLSANLYQLRAEDVVGNHCALHYDISTFGYFSAPLAGATTVIVSDAHTKFPLSLLQLIAQEKISVWYSVPLALTQLIQTGNLADYDLSSLRWVLFGGEPFPPDQANHLMAHLPNARFSNVYGPAEVNQCTYYHFSTPPPLNQPIPLGQTWDDTDILIVDEDDQEVKVGEIGELLVSSSTMMQAYWKAPELNRKAFYYRQKSGETQQRFYRTGDLVCTCLSGTINQTSSDLLFFMGRKDRQIKTRGYRVELEEVENVMNAQTMVQQAAVFPFRNGDEGYLIKAVVVPSGEFNKQLLWQQLAESLPKYALPQTIKLVNQLPRTEAGKIDRRSLQNL